MRTFDRDNETDKKRHQAVIKETKEIAEGIATLAKFANSFQYQTSAYKVLCVQVVASKESYNISLCCLCDTFLCLL